MFRFTIRDMLWLTLIAGMGIAWFISHQATMRRYAQLERAWTECFGTGPERWLKYRELEQTRSRKLNRISVIAPRAKMSPPSELEATEILHCVRFNTDFRSRIAAIPVVPYLNERTEGIECLILLF